MKEQRKLSDINSIIDFSQGVSLQDFHEKLKSPEFSEKLESRVNWVLTNKKKILRDIRKKNESLTKKDKSK